MPAGGAAEHGAARWLPAALALVALAHAATFWAWPALDDELITWRYARSLVEGDGLVFQPGERVEGYTQPLWVLAMAAGLAVGAPPLVWSRALGGLAAAAAAWAAARAWRGAAARSRAPFAGLAVALSPAVAFHAAGGLGTTLLAALLALWAMAWEREERTGERSLAPAAWLGLAGLARAEALLLALPFVWRALRRRRLGAAALALAPLAAWTAFRLAYYGALLPQTWATKKLPFAVDLRYGAGYLARATLDTGALVWLVLAVLGVRQARRARDDEERAPLARPALRALVLGLALHAAYVLHVGGDYMHLARFLVPTLPLLFLTGGLGARALLAGRPRARLALGGAALLALLWPHAQRGEIGAILEQNERRWIAVGKALHERVPPGTSVAVSAIGAIGWYSRLPIVDVLGLVTPEVARAEPDLRITMKGHHRHDADAVLAREPELVVPGAGLLGADLRTVVQFRWEEDLLAHPELAARYRPMVMPVAGSYPLVVLVREGVEPPRGALPTELR